MVGILYFELLYNQTGTPMKYLVYFLLLIGIISCQEEQLLIVEEQPDEALTIDEQLRDLVVSVAAHDGSFDDVVDNSSCFSIDFPYVCTYNGHEYPMNSRQSLEPWNKGDVLIPVFPVTITFANHLKAEVPDAETYKNLIALCASGDLFDEIINCVDLVYPISISTYDKVSSNFETLTLNHDKQTFETIVDFNENILVSVNYPIQIELENEVVLTIYSNDMLKNEILDIVPFCE